MINEEDPKEAARIERKKPSTEKTLKQFLTLESGNYVTRKLRQNYDVAIKGSDKLLEPLRCDCCDFVATTIAEVKWHEEHAPGHEFL